MSPAALSIVLVTFRDGMARGKALGYWTLVATGGAAVGMLLGGVLTQYLGWRWNFFINVPVGIVMSYLIGKFVPVHEREEKRTSMDLAGSTLVTAALMSVVYGFSQAPEWGWLAFKTLSVFGAAAILLGAFIWNEARAKHPLMPLSIFKIRNVTGANLIMAPVYASLMGMFFLTTLYIQGVLHYSPVVTGLSFLPFPILLGLMSTRIPKLVARYGFRRFLIMGPLLVAIGALWLSRLHVGSDYISGILPAFIIMPLGMGMTFMPTIAAATSGVPAHEAGLASGLISTSQQMGGALGLAILSGVATSTAASTMHLGTKAATIHGYTVAFLVSTIFMVAAMLVAALVIRGKRNDVVSISSTRLAEATS
jgi:MFS family permease